MEKVIWWFFFIFIFLLFIIFFYKDVQQGRGWQSTWGNCIITKFTFMVGLPEKCIGLYRETHTSAKWTKPASPVSPVFRVKFCSLPLFTSPVHYSPSPLIYCIVCVSVRVCVEREGLSTKKKEKKGKKKKPQRLREISSSFRALSPF